MTISSPGTNPKLLWVHQEQIQSDYEFTRSKSKVTISSQGANPKWLWVHRSKSKVTMSSPGANPKWLWVHQEQIQSYFEFTRSKSKVTMRSPGANPKWLWINRSRSKDYELNQSSPGTVNTFLNILIPNCGHMLIGHSFVFSWMTPYQIERVSDSHSMVIG